MVEGAEIGAAWKGAGKTGDRHALHKGLASQHVHMFLFQLKHKRLTSNIYVWSQNNKTQERWKSCRELTQKFTEKVTKPREGG